MDVRLQEKPFRFDGKDFKLRCNMNVLADIQESYGGDFSAALRSTAALRTVHNFLTAMLNDYADEMGWPAYTAKQVGRLLPADPASMKERNALVMGLVTAAITAEPSPEDSEKN